MINKNKKGISPVVATALLLVVAVVAVVGFQTWFASYNSANMVKVESQSNSGSGVTADRVEIGGAIYLNNPGEATTITAASVVKTSSGSCALLNLTVGDIVTGVNEYAYNITGGCVPTKGASAEVIVYTANGVYSTNVLLR